MTTAASAGAPPAVGSAAAGIGMMLLGILIFSLNDALGKWLMGTYTVGQVLLFRSIGALAVIAWFLRKEWLAPFFAAERKGLHLLRVVLLTAEVACFYGAVAYLPLADVMTYYLAGPIYVTLLSALILREHVGWRRWLAVLIGFIGVIVALKPSAASLSLPAFIAIAGSLVFAFTMIITRYLRGARDVVLTGTQFGAAFVAGAVASPFGWSPPTVTDILLTAMVGIIAMVAMVCVNRALKLAPASVVVPYQYTMIVWAVVFGYIFFGDVPQAHTLIGAAIIVGAGLFIYFRERALARRGEPVPEDAAAPIP